MGTPTSEQLEQALCEAARMREQDEDSHHIGKCLLSHNYRLKLVEQVLKQLEVYLHSGQDVGEHSRLVRAIERCHDLDRSTDIPPDSFGLE